MREISLEARAKINLFLQVGPQREDAYHDLVSVVQSISLCDRLSLVERKEGVILSTSSPQLRPESNLCLKAAHALREHAGARKGAEISLEKAIPLEAGLGGGSADAAATLVGLDRLWKLGLPLAELNEIASLLGSDVPFFLQGGTALVEGRGERVRPLPASPPLDLVIAKPETGIATGRAYACLDEMRQTHVPEAVGPESLLAALVQKNPALIAKNLHNDFAPVAARLNPDIMKLKQEMLEAGCLGAEVCGSGSAVFGITSDRLQAEIIRDTLRARWPWVVATTSCGRGIAFVSGEE